MAASMLTGALGSLSGIIRCSAKLAGTGTQFQQSVRNASKKAGSTSRNKRKNTKGKYRGYKKEDGHYVESGMILFRQLGLRCYPGANVGAGTDLTLFALEPGRVIVTREKLRPFPHSPLYPAVQAGRVVYKKFYNVIPEPQPSVFKLVSQT